MTTIVKCGISKYIGLPESPDLDAFERMCTKKILDVSYDPITFLCALLQTPDDAINLYERLKFSAYERDMAFFIMKNNEDTKDSNELM